MRDITVLLVDDQVLVREGFRQILDAQTGIHVVGAVSDGEQAVEASQRLSPDVVLMETWLPCLWGVSATEEIRKTCPNTRVLILSAHQELRLVEAALRAGAAGYLVKNESSEALIEAVKTVHRGGLYISPGAAAELDLVNDAGQTRPLGTLTSREREILQHLAEGLSAKEVAGNLGISIRTAESHRANLMRKLGVHKTAGLVRIAIREGLIAP